MPIKQSNKTKPSIQALQRHIKTEYGVFVSQKELLKGKQLEMKNQKEKLQKEKERREKIKIMKSIQKLADLKAKEKLKAQKSNAIVKKTSNNAKPKPKKAIKVTKTIVTTYEQVHY